MDTRRSVTLTVLARLVSSSGAEAAFFIGLWGKAAYEFDGTPADLAVMSAVVGIAAMVGSVAGGALVDRFDPRRVVIASEVAFVPVTLSLILADDLTTLIPLGGLTWLVGAMLETGITSLPPVLVADEALDRANARLEMANWLALVAGPAFGAVMFPFVGFAGIFVFDAITSVVALLLVLGIALPATAAADVAEDAIDLASAGPLDPVVAAAPGPVRAFLDGLSRANASAGVRVALYLTALPAVAFGMFIALEPLFYRDVVGAPVETLGYVNTVFGFGLFAGSLLIERTGSRLVTYRGAVLFVLASGLGSVLYTVTGDLRVVLLGAVTWSIPLGVALPLVRTLAQKAADPAYVGRVTGMIGTVDSGAALLPVVVAPLLADRVGVQVALVGSGLVAAVLAPLVWRAAVGLDAAGAARRAGAPSSVSALEPAEAAPQEPAE